MDANGRPASVRSIIRKRRQPELLVLKWLLTIVIAIILIGAFSPWLRRVGIGRMPGDIHVERDGRRYSFPLGSTMILSLLVSLVYWMLR